MGKENNTWKIIAIIFIIIAILEFLFIYWAWVSGSEILEKEDECSYNVCVGYDSYLFDEDENICYCYIDNEIEHYQYLK